MIQTDKTNKRSKSKYRKERAVRRCPFVAGVEVTDVHSGTRLSGRTSELGLGGCYVDVLNPFQQGAEVQVKMVRDQGTFEAKAKVAYCDPKFGMGLAFSEMTAADRAVLENWLVEMVTLLHPTT
jgi:hypothetical protein